MEKIGFILNSNGKSYVKKQQALMKNESIDKLIFGDSDTVDELFEELNPKDTLIVSEPYDLQKTIVQLKNFILKLDEKQIVLKVLNKSKIQERTIDDRAYMDLLIMLGETDQEISSHRATISINKSGRVGRPKIEESIIIKIKEMSKSEDYTIMQIAETCQVSLGTVYKYRNGTSK